MPSSRLSTCTFRRRSNCHSLLLRRIGRSLPAVVCLLLASLSPDSTARGQGLLGKNYIGFQLDMARPNDPLLREIDDWQYGARALGNIAFTDTLDFNAEIGTTWLDGTAEVDSLPIQFNMDLTAFSLRLNKHWLPDGPIDPFAGIGIGYSKGTIKASSGGVTISETDDAAHVDFLAGFEWRVSDRFAIRPQIYSGDSVENFDVDDVIDDNLFFSTYFIHWWGDRLFSAFGIGSDFDDTDVELNFLIGVGNW